MSSMSSVTGDDVGTNLERSSSSKVRRASGSKNVPPAVGTLSAVCWPPCGIVPRFLVENRSVAWTIMPDGSRFQPTESTKIHVWKVKMDRPLGGAWTAERESEVPIKDFAVDCSSVGEPFCVVFWPDFGNATDDIQLEVELSGLRGDRAKLNFFYEFRSFVQNKLNEHLCAEAASFRAFVGDHAFWGPPVDPGVTGLGNGVFARGSVKAKQSLLVTRNEKAPHINLISYQEVIHTVNCVDVTIVLQSDEVLAIFVELHLVRFSGEEEEVDYGAIVQKLPEGNHFLVRAKLPMSRQRFEIRLFTTSVESPDDFKRHPLRYTITTGNNCKSLLSTLEDPRKRKFGYCPLDPSGQINGIVVIAPVTRRIATGDCYFLVYVDKAVALAAARAEVDKAYRKVRHGNDDADSSVPGRSRSKKRPSKIFTALEMRSSHQMRKTRLFTDSLEVQECPEDTLCKAAAAAHSAVKISADAIDEGEMTPELSPKDKYKSRQSIRGGPRSSATDESKKSAAQKAQKSDSPSRTAGQATTVSRLHFNLRALLEGSTQDATTEIALDLSLRGGEVLYRMKERSDFPGLYEALVTFSEAKDLEQTVQLSYRFPIIHAYEYAPRKLGEWFVSKDEQLPLNF